MVIVSKREREKKKPQRQAVNLKTADDVFVRPADERNQQLSTPLIGAVYSYEISLRGTHNDTHKLVESISVRLLHHQRFFGHCSIIARGS